ncbi:hypothetical protein FDUTEX481_09870 [Tolypothrix sp. PCC 7601]|nr:hypothetical protein FDUTEX481_09870 [Tolypothrix sp. PCC 7601]
MRSYLVFCQMIYPDLPTKRRILFVKYQSSDRSTNFDCLHCIT